jgi:hypothetical protein
VVDFVIVNGDEDSTIGTEELAEEFKAWKHHAEPFVVAGEVVAPDGFGEPLLDGGRVYVVVVCPAFVAGVIGRVDVDALHLSAIARKQGAESLQVISFDDEIFRRFAPRRQGKLRLFAEQAHGNVVMMIENVGFTDKIKDRHSLQKEKTMR